MIDEQLRQWLEDAKRAEGELVEPDIPIDKLMEELQKRLEEQTERHDGGSRWVGTGGRSPFGHSGRASHGVRVGGQSKIVRRYRLPLKENGRHTEPTNDWTVEIYRWC